jgi:uncharacterized NAD(P)/FAD-binding protein YdhS
MRAHSRTIAIVGAGFSGTTVATQLLRLPRETPLRIVLIERAQVGRGAAYGRHGFPYLLNVPAARMSANPADPSEFLAFASRRDAQTHPADFLPRELYGDYLEAALADAEAAAGERCELVRVCDQVIALERPPRAGRVQLHLEGGPCIDADAVVLALGQPAPAELPGHEKLARPVRYLSNPWAAPLRFRANETVLLAGTGLTMADVAVAAASANRTVRLHAMSRHGLLPAPQTDALRPHEATDPAPLLRAASQSLPQLVRAVRALTEETERKGGDWRDAIAGVREIVPALWERLAPRERRRFLRHMRAYWDVHRHRLAGPTWSALQQLHRSGALQLHAGRILDLQPSGHRVRVAWQPRGSRAPQNLTVDRVINCTGPDYDLTRTRERLLRSLVAQGLVQRDPLGLGLLTDANDALIDASGRSAANLFYIGPMLRATHWESTAVVELRAHAAHLARYLSEVRPGARTALRENAVHFVPPAQPPVTRVPIH